MSRRDPADALFVAIDTTDLDRARTLIRAVGPEVGGIKLGLEFFCRHGPAGVRAVIDGRRLFLDLKLHDIPNTVGGAIRAVASLRPYCVTVHAAGGVAMLRAAREAAVAMAEGDAPMRILGVTVLTSLDEDDLASVGQVGPLAAQAVRLASLAQEAGLDGAVVSPLEVGLLRRELGPDFLLVVPGIRPDGSALADQKRTLGPGAALAAGASHLVVGRPITAAPDPAAAARVIVAELAAALDADRVGAWIS